MNTLLSADSSSTWVSNIGGILTGISELLGILGAGIGFLIRARRNAKRARLRTEAAASLAAQEAKKILEEKLDRQYTSLIEQYKLQIEQLEAQIRGLQDLNANLLERILGAHHD
jgi:uncharacterized protein HemX